MSQADPDVIVRRHEQRWSKLTPMRAVRLVIVVAALLAFIAALLERLIDPAFNTFGDAAWWAISTVSTVGYGDILPESAAGRWVAAGLMLLGTALIPILTSVVVSVLIANGTREGEIEASRERAEMREITARFDERLERIEGLLAPERR